MHDMVSTSLGPNLNTEPDSSCDPDQELLADFRRLWADASDLWDQYEQAPAFHGYVSADYLAVFQSLAPLRGRVLTFLEWGSGLGVATIMASRMGFEAYGIEAEAGLVEHAERLALAYGPQAQFAQGSFIPDDFVWNPAEGEEVNKTMIDIPSAYDELSMELRDFDLIYTYPWPDEHTLYHSVIRQFARKDALLLSYDAREGMDLVSFADG